MRDRPCGFLRRQAWEALASGDDLFISAMAMLTVTYGGLLGLIVIWAWLEGYLWLGVLVWIAAFPIGLWALLEMFFGEGRA